MGASPRLLDRIAAARSSWCFDLGCAVGRAIAPLRSGVRSTLGTVEIVLGAALEAAAIRPGGIEQTPLEGSRDSKISPFVYGDSILWEAKIP